MLKVVIADDEARICRLVQMLADWDQLGMEVAATASNGIEALEAVTSLRPEILITDIRMPGCDGLELIERAKKLLPELEIVIISGYAQFEYAQAAIRCGVSDYLLKPIKKDALMATLGQLGEKCRKPTASRTEGEAFSPVQNVPNFLPRLVEDLLQDALVHPTNEQLRKQYGFSAEGQLFQVYLLKLDYDPDKLISSSLEIVKKKVLEIFMPTISPLCAASTFQFFGSAGYGVLNYVPEKQDTVRRSLRTCLNQLEAQKFFFGSVSFSLAIGSVGQDASTLSVSLKDVQKAICQRLMEGTGRMFECVPLGLRCKTQQMLDQYRISVGQAVDILSADASDKAVEDLLQAVDQFPQMQGYELFDLVLAAGKLFVMRIHPEGEDVLIRSFTERCQLCGRIDHLFACLRQFQRQQIQDALVEEESKAIRPIRIAKEYIQQHYAEPITLEEVCAAIGFSVSYFSTMFKKETGEGFSKYLTRIRIEQAKTLLQETNLSVLEICHRVGYSDLKHFKSTFKKTTNLNPGQYRKLYG